ncbi:MAG TPA: hypothetical protein P5116_00045 [Eubacteriales bacterium]|nr:hypothetical protein [Clostridia bacterium]HRV72253.1 hypothetical protein [Eubacteriales bacterium]
MTENKRAKHKLKGKIISGCVGAATALGLAVGSLFSSPADIIESAPCEQPAIVIEASEQEAAQDMSIDDGVITKKRRTLKERLRDALLRLPVTVRILVLVPLWCVGAALIWVFSWLWSGIGGTVLQTLLTLAVLLGIYLVCGKTLFPNKSVKQLLLKRNLVWLAIAALILVALNLILPLFVKNYDTVLSYIKCFAFIAVCLALCIGLLIRSRNKTEKKETA